MTCFSKAHRRNGQKLITRWHRALERGDFTFDVLRRRLSGKTDGALEELRRQFDLTSPLRPDLQRYDDNQKHHANPKRKLRCVNGVKKRRYNRKNKKKNGD
jgi:hypothetical protein